MFYTGNLCQITDFDADETTGFLHILKSGRLTVKLKAGPEMRFDEPVVLFLPRNRLHSFVPDAQCGADLVCGTVDLGGPQGSPLVRGLPELLVIPLARISTLNATISLLMDEAFGNRSARQAAMDRLMEYFLILLIRHAIDNGEINGGILAATSDPRLGPAVAAIHERPDKLWTLEDLAQVAGMSRARFAEHFKSVSGLTPMDYLSQCRMTIAQHMLRQGKPIKSIAATIGYNSPVAFGRAFTKIVGQNPRAWLEGERATDRGMTDSQSDAAMAG